MSDRGYGGRGHGGAFPPPQLVCPAQQQCLEALLASYQSRYGALPGFPGRHGHVMGADMMGTDIITATQRQRAGMDHGGAGHTTSDIFERPKLIL